MIFNVNILIQMSLSEWKTEKAILEQRNELLQLQVQELKEREENYKKFNDTILNAYNSLQTDVNKQNVLHSSSPSSPRSTRKFNSLLSSTPRSSSSRRTKALGSCCNSKPKIAS